ncbi:DNA-binding transcriptional regulator, MerR family [Natronincola peptidivorans]|uniref:DNA-binding transcriptional regulator, MerR family n=1 Tax=Natronincola peptidivorans TaxID=426128 RepID=A0A1I0E8W6_9FIRM|nr:MerR family transcriptional regulator [Natronincola peptidivorans]SET40797.1 DNA-binding transcriptional regulator, MerR family [Natronincola peptidivorans]
MKYYKTSEIAELVCVHPNTVRLYEKWKLLQPVPRNCKGYRLYTEDHLEQMRLARIALRCNFIEGNIRNLATDIVKTGAQGDLQKALNMAYDYRIHIQKELTKAEEALEIIYKWLKDEVTVGEETYMKRKDVANLLNISIDVLRDWERNGLIKVPRSPNNNYRMYGAYEIRRLKVIRTLRNANYSMMSILRMFKYIDEGKVSDVKEIIDTPSLEEDIISATDRWITTLIETIENAEEVIVQLEMMIESKEPRIP